MSRLAHLIAETDEPIFTAEFPSLDGNGMEKARRVAERFRGWFDAVNATVSGEVQTTMSSISNVRTHIPTGKLRVLGVLEGKRFGPLADVPTLGESVPGFEKPQSWFGLFGPAAMPQPVVMRLYGEMSTALKSADVRPRLEAAGMDVIASTPDEFAQLIKRGFVTYGAVAKRAGLKPQ